MSTPSRCGMDGVTMPFTFKSRRKDGTIIERGTPIRQLGDTDLHYIANMPAKGEDKYGIRQAAKEELMARAQRRHAEQQVHQLIDICSSRSLLRKMTEAL